MPSDLNLKKSWNPKLLKNREKIWEREHQIFEEYKKNQQHQAKLQETKEKDDLLSLAANTKPGKPKTKTDWMYQSPVSALEDSSAKLDEDILLGRTRLHNAKLDSVDSNNTPKSKIDKVLQTGIDAASKAVSEERSKLSKSDPLYAIKLQQLRRKELMEKQRKIEKYKKKESERMGKHRHSSSHRHHHRDKYKSSDKTRESR